VACFWPPDGFPDAPCPDRLTVQGGGRYERSESASAPRAQRSLDGETGQGRRGTGL